MKKKKIKLFLIFFFLFSFLGINPVLALEINYPKLPGAIPPQEFIGIAPPEEIISLYVLYFFNLIIWLAGIIAFGALIYAGILYLTAAGNPEKMATARKQISQTFLGTIILLSSYLILNILNPQLTVIQLPKLEPPKVVEKPEIPSPEKKLLLSSIDAELPLGRIIEERIFETYVSPDEQRKPRMTRIKENASASLSIATKLKEQNTKLKDLTYQCTCSPICIRCISCLPNSCTSDPCCQVRAEIEKIQEENLKKIEELKTEQAKTIEEIKQLKIELGKLERLENFLTQDCRLWTLQSLREFLIKVDDFKKLEGELRQIRFWDDIDAIYWSEKEKKKVRDWASFYCQVGGTSMGKQPPQPPLGELGLEIPEEHIAEIKSCPREAPIGEVIDRTKRTAQLLIQRVEALYILQKEAIKAVDEIHVAVSQCTSRKCHPVCRRGKCIRCAGTPCPYEKIEEKLKEIIRIQEAIKKVISEEKKEEIGIIPIIDKVVTKIIEDLKLEIKYPMEMCVVKGKDRVFFDTQRVLGAIDPKGIIIRAACYKERAFDDCLEVCYLEEGQEKYRKCLESCLDEKAKQYNIEEIAWCRHALNFYCCDVKKEIF